MARDRVDHFLIDRGADGRRKAPVIQEGGHRARFAHHLFRHHVDIVRGHAGRNLFLEFQKNVGGHLTGFSQKINLARAFQFDAGRLRHRHYFAPQISITSLATS